MMEKSRAKNSVVSSAPRLELVTPLLEKLLVDVCLACTKWSPPERRLRLRDEATVKTGPDFRVRNTAAGAAREQPCHDVRCNRRWRLNRRADLDFRETLSNPCTQQSACVRRVDVTDSRARELRREIKRNARSFEIISCAALGRKFAPPALDFTRARAIRVPFGFNHDRIRQEFQRLHEALRSLGGRD